MANDNLLDILSQMPQIPEMPEIEIAIADSPFEVVKRYIQDFERSLDPQHEVGIMMTNFGQSIIMQVKEITYENPSVLVFKGYVNGRISTLIQHMSQLNFLLTSLDKVDEQPKRPIGFIAPSK